MKNRLKISDRKLVRGVFGINAIVNLNAGLCFDGSKYEEDIEIGEEAAMDWIEENNYIIAGIE